MAESTVRIGLVLPDVMGTYGDGGNSVVLRQRLLLRGIDAEIVEITLADPVPESLDLYTLGGAEDYAQRLATKHLIRYPGLQQAAARGAPVLSICAAIQVLGHWYETSSGERVDGVGLLDVTTSPQHKRTIGEVVSQPLLPGLSAPLTVGQKLSKSSMNSAWYASSTTLSMFVVGMPYSLIQAFSSSSSPRCWPSCRRAAWPRPSTTRWHGRAASRYRLIRPSSTCRTPSGSSSAPHSEWEPMRSLVMG